MLVTKQRGHTTNAHTQWYHQEESTTEPMEGAKVLITKDDGVDFKNKKMDDLHEHI